MATVNDTYMGLVDKANMTDPDGSIAMVADVISKSSALVQDMKFREGNLETGHKHSILASLPTITWGQLYQGIAPTKATRKQVVDTCGMAEALSSIDERLLALGGNEMQVRLEEDSEFLIAMGEEVEAAAFYHNEKTDPEKITGLTPRYNTLPTVSQAHYHEDYRDFVIAGGGSGADNTSIWFVHHGPEGVFGIYPKGTKVGLQTIDRGSQKVLDGSSNPYFAKMMEFRWNVGVAVKNYKAAGRICNIDISDLSTTGDTIIPLMIKLYHRIPPRFRKGGKWYCNSTIGEFLHHQARNKASALRLDEYDGMEVVKCMGLPVRESDQILNAESLVTT